MILFHGLLLSPQNAFISTEHKNITAEETNPGHCVSVRPQKNTVRSYPCHPMFDPSLYLQGYGALAPAPN